MRRLLPALILLVVVPLASADSDPQMLYNMARQAQIQAELYTPLSSPENILNLVNQAAVHVEAIMDSDQPKTDFLLAMDLVARAFILINTEHTEPDQPDYDAALVRLEIYHDQLTELAGIYGVSVDYHGLDLLFEQARQQDGEGMVTIIDRISSTISIVREEIEVAAAEYDAERALEYGSKYVAHLERLVAAAETLEIPDDTRAQLEDIAGRLAASTEHSDIISIIREAIILKEGLELDKINDLEVWIMQTENTILKLWNDGQMDSIEYNGVMISLQNCKDMLALGSLYDAEILLGRMDNWLLNR